MMEMISDGMHFGAHGNDHHWFEFITKNQQEINKKAIGKLSRELPSSFLNSL